MTKKCKSIQLNDTSYNQAVYEVFTFVLDRIATKIFYTKIKNSINKKEILLLKKDTLFSTVHKYLSSREHFMSISYLSSEEKLEMYINKTFGSYDKFDEFFIIMDTYESIFDCEQYKLNSAISIINHLIRIISFDNISHLCLKDESLINLYSNYLDFFGSKINQMMDILGLINDSNSCKPYEITDDHIFLVEESFFRTILTYVDDSSKLFFLGFSKYGHHFFILLIEKLLKKNNSKEIHEEIINEINRKFRKFNTMGDFGDFFKNYILVTQPLKSKYEPILKEFNDLRNIRNELMHNMDLHLDYKEILTKIYNNFKNLTDLLSDFNKSEMKEFVDSLLCKIDKFEISENLLNAFILVYSDLEKKASANSFWSLI